MSYVTTDDGVQLYYEDAGSGENILFVHEFGGDHRSWEPQIRFFSRRYRCITYGARGYPPSDVPVDGAKYSQQRAMLDAINILDGLNIERAHIVGLSMGGFTALHLGLEFPHRARSLVVGGCGYGAEKEHAEYFKGVSLEVAQQFESLGSETFARTYAGGAARVQFQNKDPRGWEELVEWLSQHSSKGAANTMRGVQAERPSLYDLESRLRNLDTPTLVINGDEDDHCLQPGLFLKRTIPACGLLVLPKTGHTINLEEPNAFNSALAEFFAQVEADQWSARDPRADPAQVMRTR